MSAAPGSGGPEPAVLHVDTAGRMIPISDVVRELAVSHSSPDQIPSIPKGGEIGDLGRRGKHAFEYVPSLQFFLNDDRGSLYQPLSPLLLRHYIENTSTLLVVKTPQTNPFINHLLPLAYFDDLIMHAVLAMSGQHLLSDVGGSLEIQRTTLYHYGLALRHVREATKDVPALSALSAEKILHLLLVMLILSNVEAFSGNRSGAMFLHLRASRQLILHLLGGPIEMDRLEIRRSMGFALEMYSFLNLVANVTPYGALQDRTLPFDSFLLSLSHLEDYETFGIFLGCGYALFEMIPRIALFSRERLREEENQEDCSPETMSTYQTLLSDIENWKSSPPNREMKEWHMEHRIAGEMYRHNLFIYLKASMCGSCVDNPKTICEIQKHVDIVLQLRRYFPLTPYATIMLWPFVITGSCLIQQDQRQELINTLACSEFRMGHLFQACELLEHLWADDDRRSFGPYGLYLMMKKHNLNLSMA
ncbi:hypothetical protein B0A52_01502 [Exophiala mesophila]|uniref:Transcription factor domain-containing protein n=1 Tax=Exophiala mesophila TaxID=212818 RepID=A0A438NF54_EXOME|nr:hypothetical protein B0A52_01502 [Exophiala mesophila]